MGSNLARNPFHGRSIAARYAIAGPPLHGEALRVIGSRVPHAAYALDLGSGTGFGARMELFEARG